MESTKSSALFGWVVTVVSAEWTRGEEMNKIVMAERKRSEIGLDIFFNVLTGREDCRYEIFGSTCEPLA